MEYWPFNAATGDAAGSYERVESSPDLSSLFTITASAEVVTSLETLQRLRQLAETSEQVGASFVLTSDILRVLNGDLS